MMFHLHSRGRPEKGHPRVFCRGGLNLPYKKWEIGNRGQRPIILIKNFSLREGKILVKFPR